MSEEELQRRLSIKQAPIGSHNPILLIFDNTEEKNDYMLKDIKLFNEKCFYVMRKRS